MKIDNHLRYCICLVEKPGLLPENQKRIKKICNQANDQLIQNVVQNASFLIYSTLPIFRKAQKTKPITGIRRHTKVLHGTK
jgi:hypothetical protein